MLILPTVSNAQCSQEFHRAGEVLPV